jgi:metal transporter CNNM
MRKKTVGEIMTHIDDAYMLPIDSILDFATVNDIMNSGYSRIPVFEYERRNIQSLLYIKDLAIVDTDANTPLRTLCEFYQNDMDYVLEDLTLDVMFKQFKEGNKGHVGTIYLTVVITNLISISSQMAIVQRAKNDGEGNSFFETIGLVTLEDVLEELIQAEIMVRFIAREMWVDKQH